MNSETIGIIFAGVGVVFTIAILLFLAKGVRSMQDIRDLLRRPPGDHG